MFINREYELNHLNIEYRKNTPKFIIIYGRRRVGKTSLIEEFLKDKKDYMYYLADQQVEHQQIEDFKQQVYAYTKDEFLAKTIFKNWDQFFSYLTKTIPKEKRIILAVDELTYIIKSNPAFPSILQKYWDQFFSKTNIFLIMSGSLVGLMLKKVLNYNSPLYGRRTSQIHLEPFNFKLSSKFMKKYNIENKILFYSITGGVAKYLIMIEEKNISKFLKLKFIEKEGFFYQEGMFLMSQEFKNPNVYLSILKSIALGNTKLNEISNFVGKDSKKISRYIDVLHAIGIVKREVPITKDPLKFRRGIYKIEDNYLRFWFKFIFPNKSKIEIRDTNEVFASIMSNLPFYTSFVFEDICKEFLMELNRQKKILSFSKIGGWWGFYRDKHNTRKELEIDLVALDEKTKQILFGECKWKSKINAKKILQELKEKSRFVDWCKDKRKEFYVIFAKSFKEKIKEKNVFCFDLKDLEKVFG